MESLEQMWQWENCVFMELYSLSPNALYSFDCLLTTHTHHHASHTLALFTLLAGVAPVILPIH